MVRIVFAVARLHLPLIAGGMTWSGDVWESAEYTNEQETATIICDAHIQLHSLGTNSLTTTTATVSCKHALYPPCRPGADVGGGYCTEVSLAASTLMRGAPGLPVGGSPPAAAAARARMRWWMKSPAAPRSAALR
jgi:hypothetical protein